METDRIVNYIIHIPSDVKPTSKASVLTLSSPLLFNDFNKIYLGNQA